MAPYFQNVFFGRAGEIEMPVAEDHLPFIWFFQKIEAAQQGRLSGAARSENSDDFSLLDFKINAI